MTTQNITAEFHFDFGSPNAYLSHLVIPGIEERTGVKIDYVPVLLGGVFKATGNVSPAISLLPCGDYSTPSNEGQGRTGSAFPSKS